MPLFLLGMWIYEMPRWRDTGDPILFWGAVLMATFVASLSPGTAGDNLLLRLFIGALLGFAFVGVSPFRYGVGRLGQAVSLVGAASYSIYLYNYSYAFFGPDPQSLWGVFVYAAGVILVGMVMWFLIDRNFEKIRHARRRSQMKVAA